MIAFVAFFTRWLVYSVDEGDVRLQVQVLLPQSRV